MRYYNFLVYWRPLGRCKNGHMTSPIHMFVHGLAYSINRYRTFEKHKGEMSGSPQQTPTLIPFLARVDNTRSDTVPHGEYTE